MRSIKSPRYPHELEFDSAQYGKGQKVFSKNCASCHGRSPLILSNDEVNPLRADPTNATNICRTLSTNWETGKIWAQFSSNIYKDRVAAGDRGYRTMPLVGVWATAPFLHNQSIGTWASPTDSVKKRGDVYESSMMELLSKNRTPKINVTPYPIGNIPAGTPLTYLFSRDAAGNVLCNDVVENKGHYYGSELSDSDKKNLIHWLKYQ